MHTDQNHHPQAVLEQLDADLRQVGPQAWRLQGGPNRRYRISARVKGSWLELEAIHRTGSAMQPGHLLRANPLLKGSARLLPRRSRSSIGWNGEVPLPGNGRLEQRTRELLEGLNDLPEVIRSTRTDEAFVLPGIEDPAAGTPGKADSGEQQAGLLTGAMLTMVLKEAGWQYHERPDGRLLVELDAADVVSRVRVVLNGGGSVRLVLELGRLNRGDHLQRRATQYLLTNSAAAIRFARPGIQRTGEEEVAFFEVAFGTPPSAEELDHALLALSVAARCCRRELAALNDSKLAGYFLALHQAEEWKSPAEYQNGSES